MKERVRNSRCKQEGWLLEEFLKFVEKMLRYRVLCTYKVHELVNLA